MQATIRREVKAFARMLSTASKEQERAMRARIREERGMYFRKEYTVPAMFCKLPKRRH